MSDARLSSIQAKVNTTGLASLLRPTVGKKIGIAFVIIIIAMIVKIVMYERFRVDTYELTQVVNKAGSLRMLSQKIAYLESRRESGEAISINEMDRLTDQFEVNMAYLLRSGQMLAGQTSRKAETVSNNNLNTLWQDFRTDILSIRRSPSDITPAHIKADANEVLAAAEVVVSATIDANIDGGMRARRVTHLTEVFTLSAIPLIFFYIWRSVIRPLNLVTGVGLRFASGDLSARIQYTSHDEIGNLVEILNITAERTEKLIDDLRNQTRVALESEERFSVTFNQAAVGLAQVGPDGHWLRANQKLFDILGYTQGELPNLTYQDIIHPDDWESVNDVLRQLFEGSIQNYSLDARCLHKSGRVLWTHVTTSVANDSVSASKYLISAVEDITKKKRVEHAFQAIIAGVATHSGSEFFRSLVMNLADAVGARYAFVGTLADKSCDRVQVLASWTGTDFGDNFEYQLAGTPCENVVGKSLCLYPHSVQQQFPSDHLLADTKAECFLGVPLFSGRGAPLGILVVLHDQRMDDIESAVNVMGVFGARAGAELERLLYERQLTYLANHDALTALPNRNLLQDRLRQAIAHSQRTGKLLAVLFLDLDRFKSINDSLGHDKGDQVLTIISARLAGCVRDGDTIARLGGDEFVILLHDLSREEDAAIVAGKIINSLQEPLAINGHELFTTASIGMSFYPQDGEDDSTLLKNADTAMYRAKDAGRNSFALYNQAMNAQALRHLHMETALRHALERDELSLHYQPQVDLRSGLITGVEALLRWHSPEYGQVSPAEFIPIAEDTDLILKIGAWVLKTACHQAKQWNDRYPRELRIAVNLSARQFRQTDLADQIVKALQVSGLSPELLELEITEGTVMHNAEQSIETLTQLRKMDVKLSIDDFGTGYSSLSYLKRFPINVVKIDQSFVRDITTDPDDAAIACSIIALAHSMKLSVIAEGVETEGQLGFLKTNQCDQMQGYYFSRPLPAVDLENLLSEGKHLETICNDDDGKRTLMILDDENNIGKSLRRLLRPDNYRILLVDNPSQAFELLATQHVGVIISDQRMPQMTGTEFLSRVKDLYPNTIRIVMSGYTDLQTVTDAVNQGAVYKFLTKPWDDAQLRDVIKEAFQNHEQGFDSARLRNPIMTQHGPSGDFSI